MTERRKHVRFHAKPGAYTRFNPTSSIPGQLVNISMGGLAFTYAEGQDRFKQSQELTIVYGEDDFYLYKAPFKLVADTIKKGNGSTGQQNMRQCCIKFGSLKPNQVSQLKHFIRHNTDDIMEVLPAKSRK